MVAMNGTNGKTVTIGFFPFSIIIIIYTILQITEQSVYRIHIHISIIRAEAVAVVLHVIFYIKSTRLMQVEILNMQATNLYY